MKMRVVTALGRWPLSLVLLMGLLLAGFRTCPLDSCHVRKVHMHNGVKYRARPIWQMQHPAVGERVKLNKQGGGGRREADHSRHL